MAGKNVVKNKVSDNSEGMKNALELNLNKIVTVALTEYGEQVLKEYYMKLFSQISRFDGYSSVEEYIEKNFMAKNYEGYYQFQLHELMNIFGGCIGVGSRNLPFKNNKIYFSEGYKEAYGATRVSDRMNKSLLEALGQI